MHTKFKTCSERSRRTKTFKFVLAISALLTALGIALRVEAAAKIVRIGYLSGATAVNDQPLLAAFRESLRSLGYTEGKDIFVEQRYAEGRPERLPELAAELVRLKIDLFVVLGTVAAYAARDADSRIPIVMANVADPIGTGLIDSLAHPGGRVTGLTDYHFAAVTKRLELLKEVVPSASLVAVLWNPGNDSNLSQVKELKTAAPALSVTLLSLEARAADNVGPAFVSMTKERARALLIIGDAMLSGQQQRIASLALKHRIAAGYTLREFADAGGLMSYGTNFAYMWRRAAVYVDKILKGAKPADLPVEQPTKFELVINLKTAKQIGLTIPPNVLARADRVIK